MIEYDVAISFAGEDRPIAQTIAKILHEQYGHKVFYDDYEQAALLGEHLPEYLMRIYKDKASYCIILISQHYAEKAWTNHEWRAAQARALEERGKAYVLPIRLDDTELPGLLPTVGHLSLRKEGLEKIARLIHEKIGSQGEVNRNIEIANKELSVGNFDKALDLVQGERFDNNIYALRVRSEALRSKNDHYASVTILEQILTLAKDDYLANYQIANSYSRLGDLAKSIEYYERALALQPTNMFVARALHNTRARLERSIG